MRSDRPPRILFVCDANSDSGFGHAARCLQLAELIISRFLNASIVFRGDFSPGALIRLQDALPSVDYEERVTSEGFDVAFIDRMSDPANLEACDYRLVQKTTLTAHTTFYLASGVTAPNVPAGVRCIGYQPGGPPPASPQLDWGLQFAPVAEKLLMYRTLERDKHTILIAFGGGETDLPLRVASQAVSRIPELKRVIILASPVCVAPREVQFRDNQEVTFIHNVKEVGPFLAQASVVLTSFGNLGYEALALGSPLCLLGTKKFQAELADRFVTLGLATTAGLAAETTVEATAVAIRQSLTQPSALCRRAQSLIDGRGINRIADRIINALTED